MSQDLFFLNQLLTETFLFREILSYSQKYTLIVYRLIDVVENKFLHDPFFF